VLEASIAGLPVVASRVGGLPEVIDDGRTGMLFPPGDEVSIAQALVRVVENKELAQRFGEAARRRVESIFGIKRMSKEYNDCYLRLMAKRW
jgi:glycosyltransferase involved in cell wall biosynthesis